MKCERYGKIIYLYNELNAKEKLDVDKHIQVCEHCQLHFAQLLHEQHFLKSVFTSVPISTDDAALADRIMTAINERHIPRINRMNSMLQFLQLNPVRYALTVTSVVLFVFLITELRQVKNKNPNTVRVNNADSTFQKDVKLNSAHFYESLRQTNTSSDFTHSRSLSLYESIRVCKKSNDHQNCSDCKRKYLNTNGYEGI